MAITLGAAMRKEWNKQTTLSFSTSPVGTASIEDGNDTVAIKAESVKVWLQAALNVLTGNSSVGSFGMAEPKGLKKGIELFVPAILKNSSLSRTKKNSIHF